LKGNVDSSKIKKRQSGIFPDWRSEKMKNDEDGTWSLQQVGINET
jgi:hypothetical protein